jgi:hypothetical protein
MGVDAERVVFAGHGTWDIDNGFTRVPEGTSITFYSTVGSSIGDDLGNAIERNCVRGCAYRRTYGPGTMIPNYTLISHKRSWDLVIEKSSTTVAEDTLLSELLKQHAGKQCHWAACTSARALRGRMPRYDFD